MIRAPARLAGQVVLWALCVACAPKPAQGGTSVGADAGASVDGGELPEDAGGIADAGRPSEIDGGTQDAGPVAVASGPLGAAWLPDGGGVTFRIRSAHATAFELSLFAQPLGAAASLRLPLQQGGEVWQVSVTAAQLQAAGIASTVYYGYRAWGPNWPLDPSWTPGSNAGFVADVDGQGNRFNPNKLLLDPYALEISHDPYQIGMADSSVYDDGANRDKDSAPSAMKGVVLTSTAWATGQKPAGPPSDDVIYEVHLRGLTEADPDAGCAGTYAAAAGRAPYLKSLGITAVEFQPIPETQNDTNTDFQPGNYWGYDTLAYFAPDRRYACDTSPGGPTREFAAMVESFHAQGLKVFLDVVYNHTAETGSAAILSWKGIDNASYYELNANNQGYYDNTGLGGNVNAVSPVFRDWMMDSLHHWADDLGVDGFRFDLASVLGNTCASGCFNFGTGDPGSVLNRAVAELPGTVLIAEPWAIGNGTYQIGSFPNGWSSWNDHFRDGVKNAQNKLGISAPTMGALANLLNGTADVYDNRGRGPAASINYLISHDGLTLNDLYSCDAPSNDQAWPYGPSQGGTNDNLSWNQGGSAAAQAQAARTGFVLLLTSAGTPMVEGGDELLRSIRCNNNPYNLDSVANWIDWSTAPAEAVHTMFVQRLLAFRGAHPALRPATYRTGTARSGDGLKDIAWYEPNASEASSAYLSDASQTFQAFRLDGEVAGDSVHSIFVAYDEGNKPVTYTLPTPSAGRAWYLACDTSAALASAGYCVAPGAEVALGQGTYTAAGRSAAIFIER